MWFLFKTFQQPECLLPRHCQDPPCRMTFLIQIQEHFPASPVLSVPRPPRLAVELDQTPSCLLCYLRRWCSLSPGACGTTTTTTTPVMARMLTPSLVAEWPSLLELWQDCASTTLCLPPPRPVWPSTSLSPTSTVAGLTEEREEGEEGEEGNKARCLTWDCPAWSTPAPVNPPGCKARPPAGRSGAGSPPARRPSSVGPTPRPGGRTGTRSPHPR